MRIKQGQFKCNLSSFPARIITLLWLALVLQELTARADAGVINVTTGTTGDKDSHSGFAIGKCRQRCFLHTLKPHFTFRKNINSPESLTLCRQSPDCFMCYDYCRVLPLAASDLALSMCSDSNFCSKGCHLACSYHRIRSLHKSFYTLIQNNNAA